MKDFTGICWGGPIDGCTMSDAAPIVKMDKGCYRHLDGRWWWGPIG